MWWKETYCKLFAAISFLLPIHVLKKMPLLLARSLILSFVVLSRTFYEGFTLRPCNQFCWLMPEKTILGLTKVRGTISLQRCDCCKYPNTGPEFPWGRNKWYHCSNYLLDVLIFFYVVISKRTPLFSFKSTSLYLPPFFCIARSYCLVGINILQ